MPLPPDDNQDTTPPSPDAGGSPGYGSWSATAITAILDHLAVRAELLQWEAREAKARLIRWILSLLVGLIFLVIAYFFLMVALIGWLSSEYQLTWFFSTLLVGVAHLVLGGLLLVIAKRKTTATFFPDSLEELKRDREWLRHNSRATRPR